jgi:hypothetical protein
MDAEAGEETEYTKAFGEFMNAYEKEDPQTAQTIKNDNLTEIGEKGFEVPDNIGNLVIPFLENAIQAGDKQLPSQMLYAVNKLLQSLGYKEYGPKITPQNLIKELQTVVSDLRNKENLALKKMKKNKIMKKYLFKKTEPKEKEKTKKAMQPVIDLINLAEGASLKGMLSPTPKKSTSSPTSATETPTKILSESAFDDDDDDDGEMTSISDLLFESDTTPRQSQDDFEASQMLTQYARQSHGKTIKDMEGDDSVTPNIVWKIAKREFHVNFHEKKFTWQKLANVIKAAELKTSAKKFKTPKINTSPVLLKKGKKLNFTPGAKTPTIKYNKSTSAKSSVKDNDETNISDFYNPAFDQLQTLSSLMGNT